MVSVVQREGPAKNPRAIAAGSGGPTQEWGYCRSVELADEL